MGNEASLEGGGEGPLQGLPEGLAPDGAGGFVRVPGGAPVDLAELSEEQRKQLAAAMSRAQGSGGDRLRIHFEMAVRLTSIIIRTPLPSESGVQQPGAGRGPAGLSKSRTVDAFNQSTAGRPTTGRSPSSLNLFESRFRQEPKESESKSSGMFGSSFLSGANPLSAMSSMTSSVSSSISSMGDSVNIPKFGLFGEEDAGPFSYATQGKEWLCLNCQMQRAMGGMDTPAMRKPKEGSAPPSPQRQASGKPGKLLIKQQSTTDQGLTPPTTPRQKSPGASSPGPLSPGSSLGGSPKIDPKTGRPIQQKASPQQSPAKTKQESSFFGGLGGISFGGLTDSVKPAAASSQAAESVTGKLFSGFGGLMDSSKPQAQVAPKQEESVTGKLFGGFGGLSESAKPPAAASQIFSFGSSLLNSATGLVTGEEEKPAESPPGSPPDSPADFGPGSGPGSPPDSPFSGPGSPPDSDSAPDTPPAKSRKPPRTKSVEREPSLDLASKTKESCPLCKAELNVGTSEAPNYSLCTECKKSVCNLCGFNPTPHLGEVRNTR
uniref:Zinc finger piccolo-type domain-containing protein n=1 Tax=Hippocampus comes TaxID=109280 RepID=A0A3Q2XH24_HIPCM